MNALTPPDRKTVLRTIAYLFLVLFASTTVFADEWRGIVPGRSTREDVATQFPQCASSPDVCEVTLPDQDVYITFSGPGSCANHTLGTVLRVERELVIPATLVSLNLARNRFKTFDPTRPRRIGYLGYIDDKAGLLLKAFEGRIFQIHHIPVPAQRQFCSTYYRTPRRFIETWVEHAPFVILRCPKVAASAGEALRFEAEYIRGLSILLTWVVGGKIVGAPGRRQFVLDTTGLEGRTFTVQVARMDSTGFIRADLCAVLISQPQPP